MKFVEKLEVKKEKNVQLSLRIHGEFEVELLASDEDGNEVAVLGVRTDGTIVRYSCQEQKLKAVGFKTEKGLVKLYNS